MPQIAVSALESDGKTVGRLPDCSQELANFHREFTAELRSLMNTLPLGPEMEVLDVCCGDGFYLELLAERLMPPGRATGLDADPACIAEARRRLSQQRIQCPVQLVVGALEDLPVENEGYDLVWCAQSLYSLPEPVTALRKMVSVVRPGGFVAVLENDTLHQLLLPWPNHLELALRAAEFKALQAETGQSDRYYVGRRLLAVLADAGIEPLGFETQSIDRRAPLSEHLEAFLAQYFKRLSSRVEQHLDPRHAREFAELIDQSRPNYLFHQPYLTMSWLNVLAWGRRPVA